MQKRREWVRLGACGGFALFSILTSIGVCSTAVRAASITAKSCSFYDLDKNVDASGPCVLQDTQISGHFAYVITFKNKARVTVEYIDSQSGAHSWLINGSPGMGFEVDRDHLIGGSSDLKQQISWRLK